MLEDLREVISFNTVEAPRSAQDAPFGTEVRKALDWFLNKASSYGLKVGENGGYYGWAEYGDPETPIIGVVAHVDVVPAGEGWDSDPFTLRVDGDTVYGRGVADDKGALVAILHLLREFKAEKIKFDHRIRLIVGCNEETGSLCMKNYVRTAELPIVSLIPDSDFPVINSEKGILHANATLTPDEKFLKTVLGIDAGERANVVPGVASALLAKSCTGVLENAKVLENLAAIGAKIDDITVNETDAGVEIIAKGVAGHAMDPPKSDNALWKILAVIAGVTDSDTARVLFNTFCNHDCSKTIGAYKCDEKSGDLTMNMGVARLADGELELKFDFRLPLSATPEEVENALQAALPQPAKVTRARFADNLYVPEDSVLIQTLLRVYGEATGEKNPRPIQTGGGTYARELPNAVAFGLTFPGVETDLHNANEHIAVSDLLRLKEIYRKAILELDKIY